MKRILDISLAGILLLLLAVPIALLGALVKLSSRGSVLYWSKRVGRNNLLFDMPKFRTMRVNTPTLATHLLTEPARYLTPVGGFLRRSSLDEIPQLWSILVGDMSFVGPRPALFNQFDLIELRRQLGIHNLLPGLTGWAQINGRDDLSMRRKVALDEEYLIRKSLFFDLKIILLTLIKVIQRDNIAH